MSVSIQSWQHAQVPDEGKRMAEVEGDTLCIWPGGMGSGPLITMTRADWARINREVRMAYLRDDIAQKKEKLAGYAAQEGNGYE